MNADRLILIALIGLLPILWLPGAWLHYACASALILPLFCLKRQRLPLLSVALIWLWAYGLILQDYRQAMAQSEQTKSEHLHIQQILKQGEYQTAIAQNAQGEQLYLNWQSDTPLILGADYHAKFKSRPISARFNPGNVDRQRWLFARQIRATATIKNAQLLNTTPSLRARLLANTREQTAGLSQQGLLLALSFGERAWLNEQDWLLFQQTATAHLIAISGLHIALAAAIGFSLAKALQWLSFRFGRLILLQNILFPRLFALLFASLYSFLAGFSAPTTRALLAIAMVLLCRTLRRYFTPWQLWTRAVLILLIIQPLNLLSDSFWLSILAVAALIFWYQHFPFTQFEQRLFQRRLPKIARLPLGLVHLQLGIWLVFSPVQLGFFQGTSFFAPLANLLIVPLFSLLIVPLILFSLLSNNLLHTWRAADWLAQQSLRLLQPLANHWLILSETRQWLLLSINLLLLMLLFCWLWQKSLRVWLVSGLFSLLFYLFPNAVAHLQAKPVGEWLMFDVGQGLAMAMIYPEGNTQHAVLYDSGASWENGSMAQLEILPYLKRHGITPQALILSHDDNDHSGGVKPLLSAYPSLKLISSSHKNYGANQTQTCEQGRHWQFGAFSLQALYPPKPVTQAKNADSCVILAEIHSHRFLLTGDSARAQEREFSRFIAPTEGLQVGHHGSKSSSSITLLNALQPKYALISSGRWNPWKMPHHEVISRLRERKIEIFNTAESGMIRVIFYANGSEIKTARHRYTPWYQEKIGKGR